MTTSHTPAPWFPRPNGEIHDRDTKFDEHGARLGDTPNLIATVEQYMPVVGPILRGYEVATANAHLIAAAPELLEAAERCRIWLDATYRALKNNHVSGDYEPLREAAEAAQKAIEKAKGIQTL